MFAYNIITLRVEPRVLAKVSCLPRLKISIY